MDLIDKAERISAERLKGKKSVSVPPKLVLPLFMQASIEDNEDIHTFYARLLSAAMDPTAGNVRSAYLGILQQIEPIDIQILDAMFRQYATKHQEYFSKYKDKPWFDADRPPTYDSLSARDICCDIGLQEKDFRVPFDNLCRLGLADSYFDEDNIQVDDSDVRRPDRTPKTMWYRDTVVVRHGGYEHICITALGCAFVEACKYGSANNRIKSDRENLAAF